MSARILTPLATVAVALPFLFGFTQAPTNSFWPLLASWGCIGLLAAIALATRWPRDDWAWRLASGLVLAAVLASAVGLVQYFAGDVGWGPWIYPSTPGQAIGNLRQRNQQATLLCLGVWALLWAVAQWQGRLRAGRAVLPALPGWLPGPLIVWALALIAAASAATASRTGALEWGALLVLLWLWRGSLGRLAPWLAVAGIAVYAASGWLLPQLLEQWTGIPADRLLARFADDGQGCGGRRALWTNVLHLIAQKPWTGWGWGELDYAHYITLVPEPRFCVLLDNAHDLPLHLAVELGIPVAALACAAVLWWLWRARPWAEVQPARQLAIGVLALIGLHSLLEFPLWYGPFQLTALVSVLLLWRGGLRLPPALCASALAAALAFGIYAGWDYWRISQLYKAVEDRAPAYRDDTQAKVQGSWLFADQVAFAELTTTPVTRANAARVHALALRLLHFSPEPRVIEPLIESAVMLGLDDEAAFHMRRFQIAYPQDYAKWRNEATSGR